ncbi:FHA domain-containing protein [Oerskovia sp. KBS0722]|uniref:FHA domain-containing protein n=1 Tax=Oerskovia sp. KBS0722 TaxID=1179673 RepID=UPI00110E5B25|nr:FHA domain-containing protein [Oerskovia sp. KBS0722]QDW62906.1 FHA domain-containing protein [Oerskovia sp. KBS0722]
MSAICPNGHASESTDYCDVCGEPMGAASGASAAVASGSVGAGAAGGSEGAAGGEPITCPHCSFPAAAGALFCENCGYDFTTGSLPEPAGAPSAATPGSVGAAAPGPLDPPASSLDLDPVAPPAGSPAAAPSADPLSAPAALTPPVGGPEAGDPSSASVGAGDPGTGPLVAPGAPGAPTGPAEGEAASARTGATPSGTGTHLPTPPVPGEDQWVVEVWIDPDWYQAQKAEDPLPSAGLPGLVVLRERSVLVGRPSVSRNIHPQIDCGADTGVSRRHCQLNTDGQRWWVEDLQSSNGTYLSPAGGELPIDPIPAGQRREVADGDRIYLGGWTRLVIRKAMPGEV